jgi:hypothetical protein
MITYKILEHEAIIIIEPSSPIRQSDFEARLHVVINY